MKKIKDIGLMIMKKIYLFFSVISLIIKVIYILFFIIFFFIRVGCKSLWYRIFNRKKYYLLSREIDRL
jgi:hypothetical protein